MLLTVGGWFYAWVIRPEDKRVMWTSVFPREMVGSQVLVHRQENTMRVRPCVWVDRRKILTNTSITWYESLNVKLLVTRHELCMVVPDYNVYHKEIKTSLAMLIDLATSKWSDYCGNYHPLNYKNMCKWIKHFYFQGSNDSFYIMYTSFMYIIYKVHFPKECQ